MVTYPLVTAQACPSVDRVYVSTDSPSLKEIGTSLNCYIIDRPQHLASKTALGEHAYVHGYETIREELAKENLELELLLLLFANAPTFTPQIVEQGIAALRENSSIDSAVSVSSYNMWSPLRARKINADGLLDPFVPFETFGDPKTLNCDRDSQGDVWFADMGISIVRPKCLENLDAGLLPQKWMGQKIYPLKQWGGLDVDEPWQVPTVEAWLQAHDIEKLFQISRTEWRHFYDSEKTVISSLDLASNSRVLDVGFDPGGLGLALKERFGIEQYSFVQTDDQKANEATIINPNASRIDLDLQAIGNDIGTYDAVFSLSSSDEPDYLDSCIANAFKLVKEGGSLVFSCRLTETETVADSERSYQLSYNAKGDEIRAPYNVYGIRELIEKLFQFKPGEIFCYGYSGKPNSTVHSRFKTVCFAVFAIRKRVGPTIGEPKLELRLPNQLLKAGQLQSI